MAKRGDRGQSEVVGTILVVALVTIMASMIGAISVYNFNQSAEEESPLMTCQIEYTDDTVTIEHSGGEPVAVDSLSAVFRNDTSQSRLSFSGRTVDEQFETGESSDFGPISNETEVLLIASDEIVCKSPVRPGSATTTTTSTTTTSADSLSAVQAEGVNTQSGQIKIVLENTGSETVTVLDFAVDATAISDDIWIDDGNNREFETVGATDDGWANEPDRKENSFLADGRHYNLENNNGERVEITSSDDTVETTFREFDGPNDDWIDDSDELVFVDAKSEADVIVTLGLSDGSNFEVYLAVQ